MGLSHRSLETTLTRISPRDSLTIRDYNKEYCGPDDHVSSSRVPINHIVNLNLKVIFNAINYMAGSIMVHLATRPYMALARFCLDPNIYGWCRTVRVSLCKKLTTFHEGKKKEFSYGSLLCSFFFEKVSVIQPWVLLEMPL